MSIYLSSDVSELPEIYLELWSIRETASGARYFVGFDVEQRDGRVSTPIVELDCVRRVGVTESGRKYFLLGRTGHNSDAEYVWKWCVANWRVESWKDGTSVLIPDCRSGVIRAGEIMPQDDASHPADGGSVNGDNKCVD
ncbi:hypothetical protein [Paraburkholderia sp. C35]|uniref:hypothetical protein n=1 Tax=Paraburkholderia sp. C35 TaxID=2126993 RepID=UPI000D69C58D|nr:hypothetical protein [Paraburkholderia sp. C35]